MDKLAGYLAHLSVLKGHSDADDALEIKLFIVIKQTCAKALSKYLIIGGRHGKWQGWFATSFSWLQPRALLLSWEMEGRQGLSLKSQVQLLQDDIRNAKGKSKF